MQPVTSPFDGAVAPAPIVRIRGGRSVRAINLDHAATTPPLRAVQQLVGECLDWYGSVHRGDGHLSRASTRAYEDARAIIAESVGADERQHVVIIGANTTWALNRLAYRLALGADDVVISTALEHHANDLPWRRSAALHRIRCDARGAPDMDHATWLLRRHAGRVRLLTVTGASNVTGVLPDITRLAQEAHAVGARIAVDAAQLAPHRPIDMGEPADPAHLDYIAFSGHKCYAPYGVGVLVGRRDTFARGEPEHVGGGVVRRVTPDAIEWADAPARDEAGTPNLIGAVALAAALLELRRLGHERIAAHESRLTAQLLHGLASIPQVTIHGDDDASRSAGRLGVVPFSVAGHDPRLVAAVLSYEAGIAVRAGAFCAQPYVATLTGGDAWCDAPGQGLIRASIGLDSSTDDIARCCAIISAIADGHYRDAYCWDAADRSFRPHGEQIAVSDRFAALRQPPRAPTTAAGR